MSDNNKIVASLNLQKTHTALSFQKERKKRKEKERKAGRKARRQEGFNPSDIDS